MPRVATGESVLSRAVRIFEVFSATQRELGVAEIARRSGLHVATASRLVAELVALGLLARTPDGRVQVGVRMWELAHRASPSLSLREAAMPYLEDVHDVVGHHVQLGVLQGAEVLFLERLSAPGAVINVTRIAGRLPVHASSSGLVLLASGDREVLDRVLAGPLERLTAHTITDPARLREAVAAVRRDGHVVTRGHIHPDAAGVAVPVRDPAGAVVASLGVVVPNDEQAYAAVPMLKAASRGVTRALGTQSLNH